jgi:hypothetical protein
MRPLPIALLTLCLATALSGAAGGTAAQAAPPHPEVAADDIASLNKIVNRDPQRYAGVVVDEAAHTVRVYVRAGEQTTATADLAGLRAPAATGERLAVQLVPVRRSQAELDTVFRQVTSRQPFAASIQDRLTQWYVDPRTNRVVVGLTSVTDEARAAAAAAFGDAVAVVAADRHDTMSRRITVPSGDLKVVTAAPRAARAVPTPTRLLDSTPYYGGDRIIRWTPNPDGTTSIMQCTAAFTVGSGTALYMSTAGHCGPTGTVWQQGYYESGAQIIHTTGTMGTETSVQWGNNRMDAAIMNGGSYWNGAVYGGMVNGTAWAVGGQLAVAVGNSVCSDGSVTKENCSATISAINACLNLNDNGTIVQVCNQALADSTSGRIVQHGDSGGPVLRHTTTFEEVVGVGLISGGNTDNGLHMNFTQIQNFSSTFGVNVVTGRPCC